MVFFSLLLEAGEYKQDSLRNKFLDFFNWLKQKKE